VVGRVFLAVVVLGLLATPAAVGYFVLDLPEPGRVQRAAAEFRPDTEEMARACQAVNDTDEQVGNCLAASIDEAKADWLASPESKADVWTGSEVATKRNSYVLVGVLVMAALVAAAALVIAASRTRRSAL